MSEGGSSLNGQGINITVPLEQFIEDTAEKAATLAADKAFEKFKEARKETCPMKTHINSNKWRVIVLAAFLAGLGILTGLTAFAK